MKSLRLFGWFFSGMLAASSTFAADRVALVIGCGKYRAGGIAELSTPVNDARKVAAALRAGPLSFDVVEAADSTRNQFFEKLAEFKARARGAKVVLVYFSGHGIEADGVNYLIPTDAVLEKPSHLDGEAIPFSTILTTMQSTGAEAKVAVLDACRNNPFGQTKSWRDSGKSISEGVLAALGDAQLPEATLVCFAASPGRKAAAVLNDSSENSPFTEFLLKRLATPGARLRDIFESTADDVVQATRNRQVPYVKYDGAASVLRQLVLVPILREALPVPQPLTPPMTVAKLDTVLLRAGRTGVVAATKENPYVNTLGMKFVPAAGTKVLFCVWETRVQDYGVFAKETKRELKKPDFQQGPTHPAVNVSLEDSMEFCKWLTDQERKMGLIGEKDQYRLPSDHEWSCAVGIGDVEQESKSPKEKNGKVSRYPWGSWPPSAKSGNYAGEEGEDPEKLKAMRKNAARGLSPSPLEAFIWGFNDGFESTSPVGRLNANILGIYDLGGNVWEWCSDDYGARKSGGSQSKTLRGASFNSHDEQTLSSSCRISSGLETRSEDIGFRCVLVVSGG